MSNPLQSTQLHSSSASIGDAGKASDKRHLQDLVGILGSQGLVEILGSVAPAASIPSIKHLSLPQYVERVRSLHQVDALIELIVSLPSPMGQTPKRDLIEFHTFVKNACRAWVRTERHPIDKEAFMVLHAPMWRRAWHFLPIKHRTDETTAYQLGSYLAAYTEYALEKGFAKSVISKLVIKLKFYEFADLLEKFPRPSTSQMNYFLSSNEVGLRLEIFNRLIDPKSEIKFTPSQAIRLVTVSNPKECELIARRCVSELKLDSCAAVSVALTCNRRVVFDNASMLVRERELQDQNAKSNQLTDAQLVGIARAPNFIQAIELHESLEKAGFRPAARVRLVARLDPEMVVKMALQARKEGFNHEHSAELAAALGSKTRGERNKSIFSRLMPLKNAPFTMPKIVEWITTPSARQKTKVELLSLAKLGFEFPDPSVVPTSEIRSYLRCRKLIRGVPLPQLGTFCEAFVCAAEVDKIVNSARNRAKEDESRLKDLIRYRPVMEPYSRTQRRIDWDPCFTLAGQLLFSPIVEIQEQAVALLANWVQNYTRDYGSKIKVSSDAVDAFVKDSCKRYNLYQSMLEGKQGLSSFSNYLEIQLRFLRQFESVRNLDAKGKTICNYAWKKINKLPNISLEGMRRTLLKRFGDQSARIKLVLDIIGECLTHSARLK